MPNSWMEKFFSDFARIVRILDRRDKAKAAGLFCLMAMEALFELFFIFTITFMGTALTAPETLRAQPLFRGIFFCFPSIEPVMRDPRYLLLLAGGVVVANSLLKNAVCFFTAKYTALFSEQISINIGAEIMSRFLYRDYTWHLSAESSTTFQRMLWRRDLATMLISLLSMYASLLTVLALFLSLTGNEPVLTGMMLLIVGAVGFFLYRGIRRNVDKQAQHAAKSAQDETHALMCATKGIREVLIYRQQKTFLQAIVDAAQKGVWPRTFNSLAPAMPTWVLESAGFITMVMAIAYLVCIEQADIPRIAEALGLLIITAWRVPPYANRVVSFQVLIRSLRPTTAAVLELLEQLRACPSEPAPDFRFEREISLRNLSFRYPDSEKDVLRNISFSIPAGKKIGIIGPSGAGKSTLVGVLSGLLLPSEGELLIDGASLDASRAAAFSRLVGYVPQAPFLFAGTLAENVAFSEWGKPWDETRVREACAKAAIDFVATHPQGIAQPIGENGAGLPGGQAQRVSVARALYSRPLLLIFDEATSALDQTNEDSIQKTVMELADEVTCVIIAHRLTTVENCDQLIWLDKGKIVMQGEPAPVLAAYRASQKNAA